MIASRIGFDHDPRTQHINHDLAKLWIIIVSSSIWIRILSFGYVPIVYEYWQKISITANLPIDMSILCALECVLCFLRYCFVSILKNRIC